MLLIFSNIFFIFMSLLTVFLLFKKKFCTDEELRKQLKYEKFISDVSSMFVNVDKTNIDEKIDSTFLQAISVLDLEIIELFDLNEDDSITLQNFANQNKEGHYLKKGYIEPLNFFSHFSKTLNIKDTLYIKDTKRDLKDDDPDKEKFLNYQIKSICVSPLISNNKIFSFLVLHNKTKTEVWEEQKRNVIRVMQQILANAIVKVNAQEEQNKQVEYDQFIYEITNEFIDVNEENIDKKVMDLLKKSLDYLSVEGANYNLFNADDTFTKKYVVAKNPLYKFALGNPKVPNKILPWFINRMKNNQITSIFDFDKDLPPGNELDRESMVSHDITSYYSIPIVNSDAEVIGFTSLFNISDQVKWNKHHSNFLNYMIYIVSSSLERVEKSKEIKKLAYYDTLTGLPNRTSFMLKVDQCIKKAKETQTRLLLLKLDVDSLISINDTKGYHVGDQFLLKLVERLSGFLKPSDILARLTGGTFGIGITDIEESVDVHQKIKNILNSMRFPFKLEDQEFFITVSIGASQYPTDGLNSEILIRNSEIAFSEAKLNGKNTYSICSNEIKERIEEQVLLTNHLNYAIEKNEISIHYQPQIDSKTEEIVGLEALVRWNHPEFGMISPLKFIPIAERTGLIHSIGKWVIQSACKQNREWQDKGLPIKRIAVNLSVYQFMTDNIYEIVKKALEETGLQPVFLELEITEGFASIDQEKVILALQSLRDLGVSISIDDFGTEYSSLSRLKNLPLDRLKIDREFIRGIEENEKDRRIIISIMDLAKNLELSVVAEGVETREQFEFLKTLNIEEIQGYYFYKPLPAEQIKELL